MLDFLLLKRANQKVKAMKKNNKKGWEKETFSPVSSCSIISVASRVAADNPIFS